MKPGDLALGIRDFFAVLVPGALLLILIPAEIAIRVLGQPVHVGEGLTDGILFLTAAYAAGALIGAAAGLLDPLAERAYRPAASFWPSKLSAAREDKLQFDNLRQAAKKLERRILEANDVASGQTQLWNDKAFWRNYLRIASGPAVGELDRVEGQQKLFRALSLVFLIVAALNGVTRQAGLSVLLAILFFSMFVTYRRRFNVRLFQLAIAYYSYSRGATSAAEAV